MRAICLVCPNVDILDAVLEVALPYWSQILQELAAVEYMKKEKYIETVTRACLESWRVVMRSSTKESFFFCKAWTGLFANGTPGLECGSQPIESFHSMWERVRKSFGGREDVTRILRTMSTLYETDSAFTDLWNGSPQLSLHAPVQANPDLLSGEILHKAGYSTALDYALSEIEKHIVFDTKSYLIVAVQNAKLGDDLPAAVPICAETARLGAAAMFASDQPLRKILFDANVFFLTSCSRVALSMARFRNVFEDIAYVLIRPQPQAWQSMDKPVCTCHIYAVQQQCQHTLFVEGLPIAGISHPRNFGEAPGQRRAGRPKGKSKAAPKRAHT